MAELPPPIPLPSAPYAPIPNPPAKPKSRWWVWVLVTVGVVVLGVGALVGAGLLLENTGTQMPASEADRAMVLTAEELATTMHEFVPDPKLEKLGKKKLIDGSHEVEYEYAYDEQAKGPAIYVNSTVTVENSADDAIGSYTGMKIGAAAQFALMGGDKKLTEKVRDDLLKFGDDSRASLLEVDGAPIGNAFLVRQGKAVFYAIFIGVYFDDPAVVKELLQPKLEKLATYQP